VNARHAKWLVAGLCLLTAVAVPPFIESSLIRHFLVLIGINVILVTSLDLVVGLLGLSALGHAGFMGIGAYTSALLVIGQGMPFLGGLVCGTLAATIFGVLIGYPSLRLGGHYFVVVTFITGIVFNLFFTNLVGITKGPMGLPGIPAPQIAGYVFSDKLAYYYLVLFFIVPVWLVKWRIHRSRMGRALAAIREEEDLARAVGIRSHRYKVAAFALSAAGAGMAGVLYAHYLRFIGPVSFDFQHSFDLFVMNLLGGKATLLGPIIGPTLLTAIDQASQMFRPEPARIVFGVCLILIIIYIPEGIMGLVRTISRRRHS
jgi:branched-chain amino acid transport system permease protein